MQRTMQSMNSIIRTAIWLAREEYDALNPNHVGALFDIRIRKHFNRACEMAEAGFSQEEQVRECRRASLLVSLQLSSRAARHTNGDIVKACNRAMLRIERVAEAARSARQRREESGPDATVFAHFFPRR